MLDKFKIGHYSDRENGTGCTVVLCEGGAVGGVSVRGSAPGTRETDLFRPASLVEKIDAVVLSGGSAFGLAASTGVMKYLYEKGAGYDSAGYKVPIVASAVLFDLAYKNFAFPDESAGYLAAQNAAPCSLEGGSIGAGTGATVGKLLGMDCAEKSGLGVAVYRAGNVYLACYVAVNALGDVVSADGKILAGLNSDGEHIGTANAILGGGDFEIKPQNTTIACIVTNAKINREQANKLADIAHDGYAKAISPVHTQYDGDTIFALSSAEEDFDFTVLSVAAVETTAKAIRSIFEN